MCQAAKFCDRTVEENNMPMWILGISAYYHDSAACLIRDGEIVAAAQEERFSRKKHDADFPSRAIDYCLQEAGGFGGHSLSKYGYQRMAELIEKNPFGDNFMWCADIQKDEKIPLYVDKMHYSGGFSKQFAIVIADLLNERYPVEVHVEQPKTLID
jgi:hypothetical protein